MGGGESLIRIVGPKDMISLDEVAGEVKGLDVGAIVLFLGTVRAHSKGREVEKMEYEAYAEMAVEQLEKLRRLAIGRFGVKEVAIWHRVGTLTVSDCSVVIAVASEHREEAFEACRFIIDELKKEVAIWKKEYARMGSDESAPIVGHWVEGET